MYLKKKGAAAKILFIEYAYDANGNTTQRTIHKETGNEVVTFEYDTLNRVTKSTEGSKWTSYRYDNAGNRFIKEGSDGSVSLYLRHGQIAVAMDIELAKTSETAFKGKLNRYVLSGDLLAGRVMKTAAMDDQITVTKSWYHLDHLNSTKCVTNADGMVEVNYTYRAFGEQLKRLDAGGQDTADRAKYSYGGKELDDATNLYYFNARYYDATIGRFISVDPIQDGSNWYVYCSNNPLSFKDPTGLDKNGKEDVLDFCLHTNDFLDRRENVLKAYNLTMGASELTRFIDTTHIITNKQGRVSNYTISTKEFDFAFSQLTFGGTFLSKGKIYLSVVKDLNKPGTYIYSTIVEWQSTTANTSFIMPQKTNILSSNKEITTSDKSFSLKNIDQKQAIMDVFTMLMGKQFTEAAFSVIDRSVTYVDLVPQVKDSIKTIITSFKSTVNGDSIDSLKDDLYYNLVKASVNDTKKN